MNIRCTEVGPHVGHGIVLFEGEILDGDRKGERVMFLCDARMAIPIALDILAGKQPTAIIEEWQLEER